MNIALTWAPPTNPPGSAHQAIRGHASGLLEAGHDVSVYYGDRLDVLPGGANEFDAVIWPSNLFAAHQLKTDALDAVHRHFHLIGVDMPGNPTAFQEALDAADTISAVDPNAATYFAEHFDVALADIAIIPNPPNRDLFSPSDVPEDGYVFAPKTGAAQKEGHGLADVAELTPNVTYETHAKDFGALPWLPFNVRVKPPVPWSLMPARYRGCAFVCNPARHEGLPNVAYEAFCSGRAYLAPEPAIGRIQSLPKEDIDTSDFGANADWFQSHYGRLYDMGDHIPHATTHDQLVDFANDLATDHEWAAGLGERSREWVDSFKWSWGDTARCLTEVIDE